MGNEVSRGEAKAEEVALVQYIASGDVQAIKDLLKQKPQLIYAHSRAGENIWHFAAAAGHVEVNQAFNQVLSSAVPLPAAMAIPMQRDISINAQTRDGLTPLMSAVKADKPKAMQQLLQLGADPWLGDNSGCTALHHASWQGQLAAAELLLQHAEAQEASAGPGLTRLLELPTNTGLMPLHYAAWRGQGGVVKLLVNAGADLAVPSTSDTMGAVAANAGSTPLHLAAMKGEVGVMRLLLRANKKLMGLVKAQPEAAAAASSTSGALQDLRAAADKYGKTPARLAWDMQR
eukprot:gene8140-8334_t